MAGNQFGEKKFAEVSPEEQATCHALVQTIDRIGDKWSVLVVGALSGGPMRFNEMLRAIVGISHRMLTLTLRGLQRDGLVKRKVFPTVPPKVEYRLSPLGKSLNEPLSSLMIWAQSNQTKINAARKAFDEAK
jgi:DNA-binding HxlR family transcriptional regulator